MSLIRGILGLSEENMSKPRYQDPTLKSDLHCWYIRVWVDVIANGRVVRRKRKIVLGSLSELSKREAGAKKNAVMETINKQRYFIEAQIDFSEMLDLWLRNHVRREGVLAASTRAKYLSLAENHLRPAFAGLKLCQLETSLIEQWLDDKRRGGKRPGGLSWAMRADLKFALSCIFRKARDWGHWHDQNPVERVNLGRKTTVREKRKLSIEEQAQLLSVLPEDVALMIEVALFLSLRVSEVLGVQERDIDPVARTVTVSRRFYRGDVDVTAKTRPRVLPLGDLAPRILSRLTGHPEAFVFSVKTRPRWGKSEGVCRDDRDILQHFLRPAAKALGLHYPGFGFHAFRREAITETAALIGTSQAMKLAGHTSADMSLLYTLDDRERIEEAIKTRQERLRLMVGRA